MMERRKNNVLKKEERPKMMERRMDKYEKEYGEKRQKKRYSVLLVSHN